MSIMTTLCYLERDDKYLMLHRTKKENDLSKDLYLGVGGKFEEDESPVQCLIREVKEETNLTLNSFKFRGLITFICNECETEYMCLFTSDDFSGEIKECDEGDLIWIKKDEVFDLPIWEGDKLFFNALNERDDFFDIKCIYEGKTLIRAYIDGTEIVI